jgi:hypothetical protein
MLKTKSLFTYFILGLMFLSNMVLAQGGLDQATDAASDFQVWFFTFLGVVATIYMSYQVMLAMAEKQQWSDVLSALGKVVLLGGSPALAIWAWGVFGP